eukprot:CAMPEP_0114237522 /NCGR_PEP_ID=MMETSP0058-20121206/7437_1 /TAXON_ID=36894 /ORGANISM="Pyramimonas parkeae, CCMP726" /LENGTH=599 /DNA_ID=CAMNT_0001349573 /DNA_START=302 /DNA_END=2101 /DNA_ORIENTATION=+
MTHLGNPVFGCIPLLEMWREAKLCDVTLRAQDELVPAHRIILAACSPFFRAMFTGTGGEMLEGRCDVIELKGVDGPTLKSVIESLYTRELEVHENNVDNLLGAAIYLGLDPVQQLCSDFLLGGMSAATCLDTMVLAAEYGCDSIYSQARRFAAIHLPEVLEADGGRAFLSLSADHLTALLYSNDLQVESEIQVVRAALNWVQHDDSARRHQLQNVLAGVRLSLVPLAMLEHEVLSHKAVQGCPGCMDQIHRAIRDICDPELADDEAPKRREYAASGLIAAGGHDEAWRSLRTVEIYDPKRNTWSAGPAMDAALSFVGSARVNGGLYVMGGSTFCNTVLRLDTNPVHPVHPAAAASIPSLASATTTSPLATLPVALWEQVAALQTPRVHAGVAELGGYLYAAGGSSGRTGAMSVVERFRVEGGGRDAGNDVGAGGCWQRVAGMATPRSSLGAASLAGELYVVGGQGGRSTYRTCEVYNPVRDTWRPMQAQLRVERKYVGVCALDNRIFAVGGMNEQRARLRSVETYDPREGRWSQVADMSMSRSSLGVAALDGRLYVAGGGGGFEGTCNDSVECFCTYTNKWIPLAPLGMGRSGLTLATI